MGTNLVVKGLASACCLSDMAGCGEWLNGTWRKCPKCGSVWSRRGDEIYPYDPEVDPFLVVDHHHKAVDLVIPHATSLGGGSDSTRTKEVLLQSVASRIQERLGDAPSKILFLDIPPSNEN